MTKCVEDKTGGGDVSRGFFKCSPKKKRPCSREGGRRSQNRPQEATGFPGFGPNGEVVVIRSEPGLLAWGGFFLHCGSSRTLDRSRFPKAGSRPAGLDGSGPPRARFARAGPGGYPPTRVCPRLKWPRCFFFPSTNCGAFLCARRFGSGAKWPVPARGSPHGTPPWPLSVSYLRSSLVSPHNKASLSLASLREPIDCARTALRTWKGPACEPLAANAIPGNPENIARATGILVLKFLTSPVWGRGRRRPAQ